MFRRLLAVPVALLGVLAAHEGAYRIVASGDAARHALLDSTGHTWLSSLPQLILLAVLGLAIASWGEASGRRRGPKLWELALAQVLTYSSIEILERLIGGHSVWPGWQLLAAGAALQVPSVLVTWLLLRYVLVPAARRLRSSARVRLEEDEHVVVLFPELDFVFSSCFRAATAVRGPPLI